MAKELAKQYDPSEVEDRTYQFWCDKKYFHAKREKGKKTYTIVIPPPNITGQLHMGHALDNTLQDILIRYHRMAGYDTLWLPGTDHASIATEAKIVEAMRKEGITKDDLGREKFLERAWDWKKQYGGRIIEQLKKMGSSCDWDRERFTLDEGCSKAVMRKRTLISGIFFMKLRKQAKSLNSQLHVLKLCSAIPQLQLTVTTQDISIFTAITLFFRF